MSGQSDGLVAISLPGGRQEEDLSQVLVLAPAGLEKRGQTHERQQNGSRANLSPERGPELSPGF